MAEEAEKGAAYVKGRVAQKYDDVKDKVEEKVEEYGNEARQAREARKNKEELHGARFEGDLENKYKDLEDLKREVKKTDDPLDESKFSRDDRLNKDYARSEEAKREWDETNKSFKMNQGK